MSKQGREIGAPYETKTCKPLPPPTLTWAVVTGYKNVENRSWATGYCGPLLIHAAQRFDNAGFDRLEHFDIRYPEELWRT